MIGALHGYAVAQLQNELFMAGAGLGVLGLAAAVLRRLGRHLGSLLRSRLIVTITIHDRDGLFDCVERWLHAHSYAETRCRNLRAKGERKGRRTILLLSPGPGWHLLRHRGTWIVLHRKTVGGDDDARTQQEHLEIRGLWRDRAILRELLEEAADRYGRTDPDGVAVFAPDGFGDWQQISCVARRPLATVILPEGVAEDLVADARAFLNGRDWYRERGLPYRRGYLLSGPPGTGKSTLVRAIAGALDLDLCLLSLSMPDLKDRLLQELLCTAPNPAILLLEDVDAAFKGRRADKEAGSGLSFSGVLDALDGVAAQEGRILFMTTNHPERLDPALIRPGRIDRSILLGLCDETQLRRLFLTFFPGEDLLAARFAERIGGGVASPASVQAHLLLHRESASAAAHALFAATAPKIVATDADVGIARSMAPLI